MFFTVYWNFNLYFVVSVGCISRQVWEISFDSGWKALFSCFSGTFEATNGATEILRSSCTEVKRFTCEFCGRHLMNMAELNYHVMRHGLWCFLLCHGCVMQLPGVAYGELCFALKKMSTVLFTCLMVNSK